MHRGEHTEEPGKIWDNRDNSRPLSSLLEASRNPAKVRGCSGRTHPPRDDMTMLTITGSHFRARDRACSLYREDAMSARTTSEVVRQATKSIRKARGASKTASPKPQSNRPEHGRQIFVYNHLQKNHVVYSLTRALRVLLSSNSLHNDIC